MVCKRYAMWICVVTLFLSASYVSTTSSGQTSATLCNAVQNATVVFTAVFTANTTCLGHVAFGQCCEVHLPLDFDSNIDAAFPHRHASRSASRLGAFPFIATITVLRSSRRSIVRGWVPLFANRARNYGFLAGIPGASEGRNTSGVTWVSPSSTFADEVPPNSTRYVWQNLCTRCGGVSAFVNNFTKRINPAAEPFLPMDVPYDEVEPLPGPPQGAKGLFTQYKPFGEPGKEIAPITFPWNLSNFRGKEPYFALLDHNLIMSWVDGMKPVVQRGPS